MRIYLTHCSKEKDQSLKGTNRKAPPAHLYTNPELRDFIFACKTRKLEWAILSDKYGIFFPWEEKGYYEKHPSTVTAEEEAEIRTQFDEALKKYDEIFFYARVDTFHPFYRRILDKSIHKHKITVITTLRLLPVQEL